MTTAGIATLPLEHASKSTRRRLPATVRGELREFLIGPENELIQYGIGLTLDEQSVPPRLEFLHFPLFVWAPTGFGKSQLLRGIAATWSHHHPQAQIICTTASEYVHAYLHAHKIDDIPQFQQRFRRTELLLIDDLDAIAEREPSQQQLASMVDHRQRLDRPTVFASRHPLHSLNLHPRLQSRLSSGLLVPLHRPSGGTLAELLDRMCQHRPLELMSDARSYLIDQCQLSVRELARVLNQVASIGRPIREADIRSLLGNANRRIDPKAVIRAAANHFGLKTVNLTGSSRRKMDVLARGIAMHLIRELSSMSYQQIGQLFAGRDHSTVMHACKKIQRLRQTDVTCRNAIQQLSRNSANLNIDVGSRNPR